MVRFDEVVKLQLVTRKCALPCKTKSYTAVDRNYLSFGPNMQSEGIWFFIDKPYIKVEVRMKQIIEFFSKSYILHENRDVDFI